MAETGLAREYKQYLNTPHWNKTRKATYRRAGHKCQLCGRTDIPLHAHHNSYERIGNEKPNDLVALCRVCHEKFHGKDQMSVDLEPLGASSYVEANELIDRWFVPGVGWVDVGTSTLDEMQARAKYWEDRNQKNHDGDGCRCGDVGEFCEWDFVQQRAYDFDDWVERKSCGSWNERDPKWMGL